jgi:hypothetical protein
MEATLELKLRTAYSKEPGALGLHVGESISAVSILPAV